VTLPKEHNHSPITNSTETKICDLPKKEFEIMKLRRLSQILENTNSEFNKIRRTVQELNEKLNRLLT
jgi:uncharacterized protein YjiS (DUF1127 family)